MCKNSSERKKPSGYFIFYLRILNTFLFFVFPLVYISSLFVTIILKTPASSTILYQISFQKKVSSCEPNSEMHISFTIYIIFYFLRKDVLNSGLGTPCSFPPPLQTPFSHIFFSSRIFCGYYNFSNRQFSMCYWILDVFCVLQIWKKRRKE